ncbi:hypothetical protein Tco_0291977 [Tanacetum coccineum]
MANENVPAPAPTRSDDQILPFATWVPIGKSNFVLDLQKKQKNPIFQISMDILQNTNFFRAFTASTFVPAIYIQQFWNTLTYEAKIGAYSFQLDESRYILDANILREALEITLIDQAHQFVSPPSGDAIMDFVNELGYTKEIHFVSKMAEEFVQAMQTFLVDKTNLSIAPQKGKKTKPHAIPYCRFIKLIICHLGRTHNIHQRSASPFHLAEEDLRHGNLKFVPKDEDDEVFRMPIPNELITNNIRNAPYYNAYLEMVAKHDQKIAAEEVGKKKLATKADKSKKPATAKQLKPKPVKEKSSKPAPAPKPKRWTPATEEASTGPSTQPQDNTSANIVRDSPSLADAKTGADTEKTDSREEKTAEIDEGQDGSDPGKTPESRPPPDDDKMDEDHAGPDPGESRAALAGPNPEPTHEEFMANVYPNVHESLKFSADKHVFLEDPLSSSKILSSMKNLDDAYTIRDQFLNDKSTEDESGTLNVEAEVVSMVTVPIHQASSLVPSLFTPVIDILPPKPGFHFRVRDLPYKINQTVNEVVKEAVHVALQAPLRDCFRELPKADMKEILHQQMFESSKYISLPEHVALYKALEASMERSKRDGFFAEKDKSRKRRCDDEDPPPPPPDLDLSKKKRHDSDASEAHSSSSKQKSAPHSEQPVDDVPIPDDENIFDSEDTDTTHLPKIKSRPDWLKHAPEEDRPATLEPD